jgi:hypothetical protein
VAELTVIWWRDIPAQVVAASGRETVKLQLPGRFQQAIDDAAMRAGLTGTDAYLSEWRRETRPCGDDLQAEASDEAGRLDAAHDHTELDRLARAGGLRERREGS